MHVMNISELLLFISYPCVSTTLFKLLWPCNMLWNLLALVLSAYCSPEYPRVYLLSYFSIWSLEWVYLVPNRILFIIFFGSPSVYSQPKGAWYHYNAKNIGCFSIFYSLFYISLVGKFFFFLQILHIFLKFIYPSFFWLWLYIVSLIPLYLLVIWMYKSYWFLYIAFVPRNFLNSQMVCGSF